jgi:hypothetical protein
MCIHIYYGFDVTNISKGDVFEVVTPYKVYCHYLNKVVTVNLLQWANEHYKHTPN